MVGTLGLLFVLLASGEQNQDINDNMHHISTHISSSGRFDPKKFGVEKPTDSVAVYNQSEWSPRAQYAPTFLDFSISMSGMGSGRNDFRVLC